MPVNISKKELQEVLVECKKKAYAGVGEGAYLDTPRGKLFFMTISDVSSWIFFDEFVGDAYFSGWEQLSYSPAIGERDTPIWSMVYRGTVLFPELDRRWIYDFLRESLKAMPIDLPFRGSGTFTSELYPGLEYRNNFLGKTDITSGVGTERTLQNQEQIYFGMWSGGLVLENFDDIILY